MDDQCYKWPYEGTTQPSSEEGLERLQLQIANALRFSDNLECQSTQNAYCQNQADFKLIPYQLNLVLQSNLLSLSYYCNVPPLSLCFSILFLVQEGEGCHNVHQ